MIREITDEFKKIRVWKYLLSLSVVLLLGNIIISILFNDDGLSSKEALLKEKESYEEIIRELPDEEDSYGIKEGCKEQIALIDYNVEHESFYYQRLSVVSNLAKNKNLINILLIFLILLSGACVSVEDDNDTWKNLIVLKKGKRKDIYINKKVAYFYFIGIVTGIFLIVALGFGLFRYGGFENIKLIYKDGAVKKGTYTGDIIDLLVAIVVKAIVYGGITFYLVLRHGKVIGTVIPTLMLLAEGMIETFLKGYSIGKFLPFRQMYILENITGQRTGEILVALIYLAIIMVLIDFAAYVRMKKIC